MRTLLLVGAAATFALAFALACSPSSPRDVVPESHEVHGVPMPDAGGAPDDYAYVARRPHVVLGLAESRNLTEGDARDIVERLAQDFESCATSLQSQGTLVEGAARIVAVAGSKGTVDGLNVRLAPGGAVAQNALLCLIAPLRAMPFPRGTSKGAPALAIEATWGPAQASSAGAAAGDAAARGAAPAGDAAVD